MLDFKIQYVAEGYGGCVADISIYRGSIHPVQEDVLVAGVMEKRTVPRFVRTGLVAEKTIQLPANSSMLSDFQRKRILGLFKASVLSESVRLGEDVQADAK